MSLELSQTPDFIGVSIAPPCDQVLKPWPVTTRELLSASLKALFHKQGATAVQAAEATGIDAGTLSKFQSKKDHLWRWPTEQQFDALAEFFKVHPHVLLTPDAVLSGRLDDSQSATTAHGALRQSDNVVTSALPPLERSQDAMPDAALFRKLTAYWAAMDPARHAELVRIAWELSDPGGERPSVGFRAG